LLVGGRTTRPVNGPPSCEVVVPPRKSGTVRVRLKVAVLPEGGTTYIANSCVRFGKNKARTIEGVTVAWWYEHDIRCFANS
jgi:hypothetical protein